MKEGHLRKVFGKQIILIEDGGEDIWWKQANMYTFIVNGASFRGRPHKLTSMMQQANVSK